MKKKARIRRPPSGMRTHYDFSGGIRGKYAARYREGTNVVVLDPDIAKQFRDSETVNRVLRALVDAMQSRRGPRARSA